MSSIGEIANTVEEQGKSWQEFQRVHLKRLENLERETRELSKKAGRPLLVGGDFVAVAQNDEHKKAFDRYLRKGDDAGLADIQRKAMNTGSDPDGGYLVIPEMDQVVDRVAPTVSAMFRLADVVTIQTAKYEKLVKKSGMAMRRVADGQTGGETAEPVYAKVVIEVFPSEVEPWVYNETLQDSYVDLATDLADEAGIAFAEGAGAEFISGDGVGKARGILSYPNVANSSYSWGNVGYITSGKSAAFASVAPGDKVISLIGALPMQYRQEASFLMNDSTLNVMRQMKDGSGSYYLWQRDPAVEFGGRLMGYPVEVDNNMPDIAAGSYSIAFGNFKRAYKIVNRAGTTLIRDDITAKGTTKFNFRRRFGGGVVMFEAIKLMRFATS